MKLSEFGKSNKPQKSLFKEITEHRNRADNRDDIIHSRADHLIQSAKNLFEEIDSIYDADVADLLKRRFLNSVRTGDAKKFGRCVRQVKESVNGQNSKS